MHITDRIKKIAEKKPQNKMNRLGSERSQAVSLWGENERDSAKFMDFQTGIKFLISSLKLLGIISD
jgi:hypothetical protein